MKEVLEGIATLATGAQGFLTTFNSVLVAFITICGALLCKRQFTLVDRRQHKDDRCDRVEVGYQIVTFWSSNNFQGIQALAARYLKGEVTAEYVAQRVLEIASLTPPYTKLDEYIKTGLGLEENEPGRTDK